MSCDIDICYRRFEVALLAGGGDLVAVRMKAHVGTRVFAAMSPILIQGVESQILSAMLVILRSIDIEVSL